MIAIIQFVFFVASGLLEFIKWAIIISAVLSWLVAFNVLNIRNQFAYNVVRFLDAVTQPVLRPFQRLIPPLGSVDISPIVAILVIVGVQRFILPALANFLIGVVAV
ncbi:MAG: YggT family protein [Phenylobacterium sp.]|uniref:YggT family protein n=1 Tax=Phenylobacterium sp. TaxID=1871053 RepID=UPI001A62CE60|nr:YggT family protein [Phenylobacterium sp.]MBL8772750.1 YggT family protein [Phenylobacterium sp.]